MNYYAVIDTNVLVSALIAKNEDSATVQISERLFRKEFIPLYSKEILDEYRNVLMRKKFGFSRDAVNFLIDALQQYGICITPSATDEKLPDPSDLPFYEVTMETREKNTYLITGNLKHFPKRRYIVTARQFLDLLDRR